MSDPAKKPDPYELAPEAPSAAPTPANLNKPPLLDDFEEDADFSKDPEVEAALKGKPVKARVAAEGEAGAVEPAGEPFVKPGFGDERVWGLVGAVLLVATLIAEAVTTRHGTLPTVATVLLMLYKVLVHTATGVIAVWVAAVLSDQRLGRMELAAGRMFAAVAALALFFSVRISIFGSSDFERGLWSTVFGAAAYLGLVRRTWGRCRLRRRPPRGQREAVARWRGGAGRT
jgi:hypothetical protein